MKITLATLKDATPQQVFDQVKGHLEKQGKQSLNSKGSCAYRGEGNAMCAVGVFISDEEYREYLEGDSWEGLVASGVYGLIPYEHADLLQELQDIHDRHFNERDARFKLIQDKINRGVYS